MIKMHTITAMAALSWLGMIGYSHVARATGESSSCPSSPEVDQSVRSLKKIFESGTCSSDTLGKTKAKEEFPDSSEKIFAAITGGPAKGSLDTFREIKGDWLKNFEKKNPDNLRGKLDAFEVAADAAYVRAGGDKSKLGQLITRALGQIHQLDDRIRAIEPNGGTTPAHVAELNRTLYGFHKIEEDGKLSPDGVLDDIATLLADPIYSQDKDPVQGQPNIYEALRTAVSNVDTSKTITGLDEMNLIMNCRFKVERLKQLSACQPQTSSPSDGALALGDSLDLVVENPLGPNHRAIRVTPDGVVVEGGGGLRPDERVIITANGPEIVTRQVLKPGSHVVNLDDVDVGPSAAEASIANTK